MRNFKFDLDVILQNCERFAIQVEKDDRHHGVTMNGKEFNVKDVIDSTLESIEKNKKETED